MKLWFSLLSLCALIGSILIGQCSGQTCDETLTINSFSENPIEDGVRTCIECVISGSVSTTATWLIGTTPGAAATTPISSSDGEVINGVLVIFDPSTIIPGPGSENNIRVSCSAGGSSLNFFISLRAFLPPVVNDVTVNETDTLTLICVNSNAGISASIQWQNSEGGVVEKSPTFTVENVRRNYTGVYTCILTRNDNNETLSANASVIVQYAPELASDEERTQFAALGGELSLSCDFVGVPTPTIEWFHNDTIMLLDSDNDVTITTDDDSSTLVRTPLERDGQGEYTCRGTNVVGSDSITITITVRVPPAPATNLRVVAVGEFNVTLAWNNGFDGFSPITGVQIEIFVGNQPFNTQMRSGTNTLETTVVTGLNAFTDYTFELRVGNALGVGDEVTVTASTLSLVLVAPTIDDFRAVNSTHLELLWTPPGSVDSTDDPDNWTVLYTQEGASNPVVLTVFSTSTIIGILEKGTTYTATVTGNNARGPGATSAEVTAQTDVDPPTPPEGLTVDGVAATALEVFWMVPTDNGGRSISRYNLSISEDGSEFTTLSSTIASTVRRYLYRSNSEMFELEENTTYWVRLSAVNSEGLNGEEATLAGATQSILEPQRLFDTPEAPQDLVSNVTTLITWPHPGGDVSNFIIEYKLGPDAWTDRDDVFIVSVPGDRLNTTLEGLEPAFSYDVRILVNNSLGMSVFSPVLGFTTADPPAPEITSNSNTTVAQGQTVVLMCVTDVSPSRIRWFKDDVLFEETSVLTLNTVQPSSSGMYECRIDGTSVSSASFNLIVPEPTTEPPPPRDTSGISTAVIIIVCVVGGLALLIFAAVVIFAVFCLCCWKKKSGGYATKKRNRSMTWMETSAQYVRTPKNGPSEPTQPSNSQKLSDTNQPSFDIPDEFTAHSSFNTLEKQNKVRRSPSPRDGGGVQYTEVSSFQSSQSRPVEIHGQGDSVQYSAVAPAYEVGSPNFEFVPPPEPAPPTHSNTTV